MTTTTTAPNTREQANRLRSALEWIDSNADSLPAGWSLELSPADPVHVDWHIDHLQRLTPGHNRETLLDLASQFGAPEFTRVGDVEWGTWAAEGSRPELTVFMPVVTP